NGSGDFGSGRIGSGRIGTGIGKGFVYTLSTILLISSLVLLAYEYSQQTNSLLISMRGVYPMETVSYAFDNLASNLRHMGLNASYLSAQPNGTTWIYYHAGYSEFFSHAYSGNFTQNCTAGVSANPFINLSASGAFGNYSAYFTGSFSNMSRANSTLATSLSQFGANMKYFCMDNFSVPTNYLGNNIRYYLDQSSPAVGRHYFTFPGSSAVDTQSVQVSCPSANITAVPLSLANGSCGAACVNFRVQVASANSTISQYANSSYALLPKALFSLSGGGTLDVEFSNAWSGSSGVRVSFTNAANCTYLIRTNMSDSPGNYAAYAQSPFAPVPSAALNFTLITFSRNSSVGGYQ
ncbi:MAG TPA: hypothetical protein PLO51_05690, partial [Candidatus Micrarchaeota archaeon]|nr:hypothetical protein [Candidatus Micrarchaeota archaeon]